MSSAAPAIETTTADIKAQFREALLLNLKEIFEQSQSYVLDEGTSFFETLSGVSAEEASRRISSQCAPIAAQVNHTRYYLDLLLDFVRNGPPESTDWPGSWQVGPVTDSEWQELVAGLERSYHEVQELARGFDAWDARALGGAIGLVAHSAYHLGEVRQGLGVLRG